MYGQTQTKRAPGVSEFNDKNKKKILSLNNIIIEEYPSLGAIFLVYLINQKSLLRLNLIKRSFENAANVDPGQT